METNLQSSHKYSSKNEEEIPKTAIPQHPVETAESTDQSIDLTGSASETGGIDHDLAEEDDDYQSLHEGSAASDPIDVDSNV